MEYTEDFDYVGDCCVCGKPLDCGDHGFCKTCNSVFCWGTCGGWGDTDHICNNCCNCNKEKESE